MFILIPSFFQCILLALLNSLPFPLPTSEFVLTAPQSSHYRSLVSQVSIPPPHIHYPNCTLSLLCLKYVVVLPTKSKVVMMAQYTLNTLPLLSSWNVLLCLTRYLSAFAFVVSAQNKYLPCLHRVNSSENHLL